MNNDVRIEWAGAALDALVQIKSVHFSDKETVQYRIELYEKIEATLLKMGLAGALADEPKYKGYRRIVVDRFKIYYKLNRQRSICYIQAIRHMRQR